MSDDMEQLKHNWDDETPKQRREEEHFIDEIDKAYDILWELYESNKYYGEEYHAVRKIINIIDDEEVIIKLREKYDK